MFALLKSIRSMHARHSPHCPVSVAHLTSYLTSRLISLCGHAFRAAHPHGRQLSTSIFRVLNLLPTLTLLSSFRTGFLRRLPSDKKSSSSNASLTYTTSDRTPRHCRVLNARQLVTTTSTVLRLSSVQTCPLPALALFCCSAAKVSAHLAVAPVGY